MTGRSTTGACIQRGKEKNLEIALDRTDSLATMIEIARMGRGYAPSDALNYLSDLIAQENRAAPDYESRVEGLLRLGACLWTLKHNAFLPGGH